MSFSSELIRSKILRIISSPDYTPARVAEFVAVLHLSRKDIGLLRQLIAKMEFDGDLEYNPKHYILSAHKKSRKKSAKAEKLNDSFNFESTSENTKKYNNNDGSLIIGRFQRRLSGIGFVRQQSTTSEKSSADDDIFIPAHWTKDAASGDIVSVEIMGKKFHVEQNHYLTQKKYKKRLKNENNENNKNDRKRRGRIVQIIERASNRFVGTCVLLKKRAFVRVDGSIFKNNIPLAGDVLSSACDGDKVVVEMLKFPTQHNDGEAVIIEILGSRGESGLDTLSIIRQFELPEYFNEPALTAARDEVEKFFKIFPDDLLPQNSDKTQIAEKLSQMNRLDLTNEIIITIDPADARDFDDAVSLCRLDNGNFRLGVHIADVTHFVTKSSAIDREAKDRATSVYLTDRVIPMLPEVLSNALASLQPNKIRFTKSVFIEFSPVGIRVNTEVYRSAICSTQRFNYSEVQEFFDSPEKFASNWRSEVRELLHDLRKLMLVLRKHRFDRGSLELDIPEAKIELDDNGTVNGVRVYPYYDSNRLIEECMLAANEAVAEFFHARHVLFLRRIHKGPSIQKLQNFTNFIKTLEIANLRVDDLYQDRFIIQRLLNAVRGTSQEYAVNISLLRSMQKAIYSPDSDGHYALASKCYCHFTSPIRRYPDVLIHRLLDDILDGKKPDPDMRELILLGDHCSNKEQRAEEAERELTKLKLIDYMSNKIGERLDAVVTNVESYGLFVMGTKIPAEGLIRVESLTDDFYRFQRDSKILIGLQKNKTFKIGDELIVETTKADLDTRQIDFKIVKRLKSKLPPTKLKI
ncbi:MAG: ribonuclease R [Planctomycetaceae bacterium]|jgi:ribonuclease R|nr:ribonuclease R [Planctomycetaceae bacterium]